MQRQDCKRADDFLLCKVAAGTHAGADAEGRVDVLQALEGKDGRGGRTLGQGWACGFAERTTMGIVGVDQEAFGPEGGDGVGAEFRACVPDVRVHGSAARWETDDAGFWEGPFAELEVLVDDDAGHHADDAEPRDFGEDGLQQGRVAQDDGL